MPQVRNLVPNREALLDLAVSGPLYGCAASGALLLAGFALSAAGFSTVGKPQAQLIKVDSVFKRC